RKPGARMLVDRNGQRVGLISGGCLEDEVVRQAFEWTANGPRTVLFDTRTDELHPEGRYGTGCEGIVRLFLERIDPGDADPLPVLVETIEQRESTVIATVYASEHTDELEGLRVRLGRESSPGSVDVSAPVRARLDELVAEARDWSRPKTVRLETPEGRLEVLLEPLKPPIELLVVGAGDDARPVAALAHEMGWEVRIADTRPTLTTRDRFPNARQLVSDPAEVLAQQLDVGPHTSVVIMTHQLATDAELVPAMLETDAPFVGLLGPRSRAARLIDHWRDEGRLPDPEQLDRLQTPLGLDLGGEAPSEVALSITSAVLAAHYGRDGGPLQQRDGRIHAPHDRIDSQTVSDR
ncbi:MAG: XdhC family protein, partial [Bradymonadaceae bacterium]